jgi:hypothetical protein
LQFALNSIRKSFSPISQLSLLKVNYDKEMR